MAFVVSTMTFAGKVSEQQALQKAIQFMKGKRFETKSLTRSQADEEKFKEFYVFNVENNGGFVIVSGDDRTEDILGYSNEGHVSMENMPDNLKYWLECYDAQIKSLDQTGADAASGKTRAAKAAIAPLIQTKWDQDEPYNLMCPSYQGETVVTGCVATAMAQVMYYHKWPASTTPGIPAYTTSTLGLEMDELPATQFNWSKMNLTYRSEDTGESANAVAELMRYCGQAVTMDYNIASNGGSAANVQPIHMSTYFDYTKTAKSVDRLLYTVDEWENLIYNELASKRPVLYSGSSVSGGHQFVVDGYDGNGYFHFNWGWSGSADGFFILSLANPSDLGIGGGTSSDGYSYWQDAIIGLKKAESGEVATPLIYGLVYPDGDDDYQAEYSRSSASADFADVHLPGWIIINYPQGVDQQEYTIDYGWGLYLNGNLKKVLSSEEAVTLTPEETFADNFCNVSFGSGLADGTYMIRQIYKPAGASDWILCEMGYWNQISYIRAVISGNNLELECSKREWYGSDITINSVNFSTSLFEVKKPVTVNVNLTNTGLAFQELICFWFNGKKTSLVAGSVEPGKTGTVQLHFTPSSKGDIPVKITTDANGNNVVWESTINVSAASEQTLSCTATTPGLLNSVLYGTTFNLYGQFKNEGTNVYDNTISVYVYQRIPNTNSGTLFKRKSPVVTIQPGETKEVDISITELDPNEQYFYRMYYMSSGSSQQLTAPGSGYFFSLSIPANETVSITADTQKATFTSNKNLDFSGTDEIKAYVATGYDKSSGTIWLTRVKDVPAGVPVVLKGPKKAYTIPVKQASSAYYKNMFKGNCSGADVTINATDGDYTNYVMQGGTWKTFSGTQAIKSGKCYLQLPTNLPAAAAGSAQSVTIGSTGKTTFCSAYDLDFTSLDSKNVKAYIVTGYDNSSLTIWMSRVKRVSAGEAMLVKGPKGTYSVNSSAIQAAYVNMMVGNTGASVVINSTDNIFVNYVLSGGQFKAITAGEQATIPQGKAYLQIPSNALTRAANDDENPLTYDLSEEPEMISMKVDTRGISGDGDTTGIEEKIREAAESGVYYNLNGQRVDKPAKGLYIREGQKVIVK